MNDDLFMNIAAVIAAIVLTALLILPVVLLSPMTPLSTVWIAGNVMFSGPSLTFMLIIP